jgi:hypothetical protein
VSITHEEMIKRNPAHTWQMLTALPSVRIVDHDTLVFAQSSRSTLTSPEDACYMQIAVDGVVLSNVPGKKTYDLRQLPPPDQIHGIEVFAGPATIPVPLGGAGDRKWCGLIAVWTR